MALPVRNQPRSQNGGTLGILRHQTRAEGKFQYQFLLPGDVYEKGVKASLDDGVLTITVPKLRTIVPTASK